MTRLCRPVQTQRGLSEIFDQLPEAEVHPGLGSDARYRFRIFEVLRQIRIVEIAFPVKLLALSISVLHDETFHIDRSDFFISIGVIFCEEI